MNDNLRGALAMGAAMALIVVNDSMIKLASESLPAAQTIGVRGLFATTWVGLAVLATGQAGRWRKAFERNTLVRAALDVTGTFSFLYALFHMPLAEATAINMAAPLMIVVFAVAVLGERVPWARWAAVLVGFVGMLLVVRPGGNAFNGWAALCLGATLVNAARDVATRRIPPGVPSLLITLATCCAVTLTALTITTAQGWQPISGFVLGLLVAASGFLAVAYYLMIVAMRLGEASFVGGFRYTGLPAAALLGWAVWGHLPDVPASVGMAVLIGAGVYLLRSQRATMRRTTGS